MITTDYGYFSLNFFIKNIDVYWHVPFHQETKNIVELTNLIIVDMFLNFITQNLAIEVSTNLLVLRPLKGYIGVERLE